MNPYRAYQEQRQQAWFRIDLVLALYDEAIGKLDAAAAALKRRDGAAARPLIERARLVVAGLIACVEPSQGDLARQMLRLYEYAHHGLGVGGLTDVEGTLQVLRTLREGLEAIRPQAVEFERSGQVPSAEAVTQVQLTA